MKTLILPILLSGSSPAFAQDSGDTHCRIYVAEAGNEMTDDGNFLSAKVMVAKQLLGPNSQVKIQEYEDVLPSKIVDREDLEEYDFDRYAPGVRYHGSTPSVTAYLTDGIDRIFDNNARVVLLPQFSWQYRSSCSPLP